MCKIYSLTLCSLGFLQSLSVTPLPQIQNQVLRRWFGFLSCGNFKDIIDSQILVKVCFFYLPGIQLLASHCLRELHVITFLLYFDNLLLYSDTCSIPHLLQCEQGPKSWLSLLTHVHRVWKALQFHIAVWFCFTKILILFVSIVLCFQCSLSTYYLSILWLEQGLRVDRVWCGGVSRYELK